MKTKNKNGVNFDYLTDILLKNKNFKNNQNYIIGYYIKDRIVENYNLYEKNNYIKELSGYKKVKYVNSLSYSNLKNPYKVFFRFFVLILLLLPIVGIIFLYSGNLLSVLYFIFFIIIFKLFIKIISIISGKTRSDYIFFRNKNIIYYKMKKK